LSIYNKGKKSSKLSDAVNIFESQKKRRFYREMAVKFTTLNSECESGLTCRKYSTFLFSVAWGDEIQAPLNDG
jgi:hypothetical protein